MYAFDERFRTEAPGNPEMVYHFLIPCLNQGFDSTAFAKYLVSVFLNSNVVKLPAVDVIGIQQLQRHIEVLKRGIAGAFFGLGGNKHLIAGAPKTRTQIAFTPPIKSTVDCGCVEIVYS